MRLSKVRNTKLARQLISGTWWTTDDEIVRARIYVFRGKYGYGRVRAVVLDLFVGSSVRDYYVASNRLVVAKHRIQQFVWDTLNRRKYGLE